MSGAQGERETARGYSRWFIPKHSPYAVLIDEQAFDEFAPRLAARPDITHVFLVTDSEETYHEMVTSLPDSYQTRMLYKSYLDNFKINLEQNL
jgi:adenine-specific DNA-methyltransferase